MYSMYIEASVPMVHAKKIIKPIDIITEPKRIKRWIMYIIIIVIILCILWEM